MGKISTAQDTSQLLADIESKVSASAKTKEDEDIAYAVASFLNEQFVTTEDLFTNDKLERTLIAQKKQVDEIEKKFSAVKKSTSDALSRCLKKSRETLDVLDKLQTTRMDLEDEILDYNESRPQTGINRLTAVDEFAAMQAELQTLERTRYYLRLLVSAEHLKSQSLQLVEKTPRKALKPYSQLVKLEDMLRKHLKESWPRLREHLVDVRKSLWEDLKKILSGNFRKVLESIQWPAPMKPPFTQLTAEKWEAFQQAFLDLLLLQQPTIPDEGPAIELPPLLPIEVMVEPIGVRFKYHFDGKRPTNRIDKPEWFFSYILTSIRDHNIFLSTKIQDIVDEAGYGVYDTRNDFVRGLLTLVEGKLERTLPNLLETPSYLSHTVYETLLFDQTLREFHQYYPPGTDDWQGGCVEVITGRHEWFSAWFDMEKEFALSRYREIIESPDAWELQYEEVEEYEELRPTRSAEALMTLLEIITDRYRQLPSFDQRIHFLMEIQIHLLSSYRARIESAVDAFDTLNSAFVRAVPGSLNEQARTSTGGVEGLKRLTRWISSAKYVSRILQVWEEEPFFIELWQELSERARKRTSHGLFEMTEGMDRRSAEVKEEEEESIFDEMIVAYEKIYSRIEQIMVESATRDFTSLLKSYRSKRDWSASPSLLEVAAASLAGQVEPQVSQELFPALTELAKSLDYLSSTIPDTLFASLAEKIAKETDQWIWRQVILRNQFSEMGAYQLKTDYEMGILPAWRQWLIHPEEQLARVRESITLLSLPREVKQRSEEKRETKVQDEEERLPETLSEVYNLLCYVVDVDEEGEAAQRARALMNSLEIDTLDVREACEVVTRRVDGDWL
ncbi:uncharacterized protein VTP21DRAFT_5688 [Calcarisporiella thermophila]|uniref:uncharacterized protein n=1 Tax=Calcarisporiella thermophila TaxID=911321 RepID=UPI0037430D2F